MTDRQFTIGVIISTYNSPEWLEKVFWGYMNQTVAPDEIIIADDGSGEDTRCLIERYASLLPLKHVWHEDNGFQKSRILNKAIETSTAEYLIFTDQDCIPRCDFVQTHVRYARPGYFLSGGYFKLPMDISRSVMQTDVVSQNAFRLQWLYEKGLKWSVKTWKLYQSTHWAACLNHLTPAKATWNGCNASTWRKLVVQVNGFNEEMQYGGQDREFGERLFNLGICSKQIRYSAIVLHLDHKRPYKTKESMTKNRMIREHTRQSGIIETPHGIRIIAENKKEYS